MSDHVPAALRRRIRAHFTLCCAYCRTHESLTVVTFEVEHIVPRSSGGLTEFENLCLACPSCNRFKSNRLHGKTDDGLVCPLFHPQRDPWHQHFDWSIDGTLIVGLTPAGKATIQLLRMNRPQLTEVRFLWVAAGKHPPE